MSILSHWNRPRGGRKSARLNGSRRGFIASVFAGFGAACGLQRIETATGVWHPLDALYDDLVATWPACVELSRNIEADIKRCVAQGSDPSGEWPGSILSEHITAIERPRYEAHEALILAVLDAAGFDDEWPDEASYDQWSQPVAVVRTDRRLYVLSPIPSNCPDYGSPENNYTVAVIDLAAIPPRASTPGGRHDG